MTRCRIFICAICRRVIAGCLTHDGATFEPIDSCAVCAQKARNKAA